jgi:hypothetical protein
MADINLLQTVSGPLGGVMAQFHDLVDRFSVIAYALHAGNNRLSLEH